MSAQAAPGTGKHQMEARKVQVKVFVGSPAAVDVEPLVPVFHEWITKNALGEMLIDVTEYGHVHEAQSLLLVGDASDYSIDLGEGRAGLLYNRKRHAPADARECVADAVRRALFAAKKLEAEALEAPIRFRGDELVIRLNDRLRAPNTKATFAAAEPVLKDVLGKLYAGSAFTVEHLADPRELFGVRVKAPGAPGVSELLARVS
jgi:hypothetical protein